ncbi:MAG: ATP-binding cassette domain-containing protein [Anderseniella sp.]|nr:ATP-binding cassette domain-containing protein [Anderseniella sp.]
MGGVIKPKLEAVEQFDTISAMAAGAVCVLGAGNPNALSEDVLRERLPHLGNDASLSTVSLVGRAAGLSATARKLKPGKLRSSDCPFITRDNDGRWHTITDVSQPGLATEATTDGSVQPLMLDGLAKKDRLAGWSLRALDGPERSRRDGRSAHADTPEISFWPARSVLLPVIAATLVINILALAIPLATMNIFDRVISNAAYETLWVLAAGVVISLVFDFLLRSLRASVLDRSSARSDVLSVNGVFGRILGAKVKAGRAGVGMQVNSLREFETVRDYFNASAIAALGDLPFVALFLLVIWLVAGWLVVVPLVAVPVFLITAILIQLRLRHVVEGSFNDTAQKSSLATEILSSIESVKLARGERWAAKCYERAVASQLRHSLAIRFWTNASLHIITLFQGMVTITILVVGVYLVTDGTITPGALFATNLLAARCLGPLVGVSALIARFTQIRMAKHAVSELAAMENERPADRLLIKPGKLERGISFDNVSFAYNEEAPEVLRDVTLTIRTGERVAVIGGNGSGKTTMLHLISALRHPTRGRVLIDDLASSDVEPVAWRSQLGVAPQSPAFMSGTVRDAVTMGRSFDDDAILKAITISGALGWLSQTGLGLDTPLGEHGQGFSGGQLQTLAVARALVGDPPVIVLDEPTSHLDGRSEAAFASHLRALPAHTTIVLVTHRPAMIEAAQRLIVMEAGKVLLDGPRDDVLAQLRGVVDQRVSVAGSNAA